MRFDKNYPILTMYGLIASDIQEVADYGVSVNETLTGLGINSIAIKATDTPHGRITEVCIQAEGREPTNYKASPAYHFAAENIATALETFIRNNFEFKPRMIRLSLLRDNLGCWLCRYTDTLGLTIVSPHEIRHIPKDNKEYLLNVIETGSDYIEFESVQVFGVRDVCLRMNSSDVSDDLAGKILNKTPIVLVECYGTLILK